MKLEVTTYSLEMTKISQFKPSKRKLENLEIKRSEVVLPEFNRFLYTAVGGDYFWTDRLPWTLLQWQAWLERDALETWCAYYQNTIAGYCELEFQNDNLEISIFGVIPKFIGLGIGGALLSRCIERAWELKPKRVWLHTCSLDGVQALANYQARGFTIFAQETKLETLSDVSPGIWNTIMPVQNRH